MSFEERPLPNLNLIDTAVSNFCFQQPDYQKLNKDEEKFYYWVNYSRKNPKKFYDSVILAMVKIYPQLQGSYLNSLKTDLLSFNSLPLLRLNPTLRIMAKEHSEEITSNDASPSHNSLDGETFSDRFKKRSLKNCGGENISYGANDPAFLLTLLYLDINLPNLGHRRALLNPNFNETGIGSSFYKNGMIFIVEDFACSQN